ncbi:hypothetical protein [Chitinophaga alhagiae]|uniref:hypothetical protein n=1 Tax=Chitinophaga alhagiae TaxID=2203219 RepID=UPI000E5B8A9D|nr:hypothetical protein [Chitinophaga alhagiae]
MKNMKTCALVLICIMATTNSCYPDKMSLADPGKSAALSGGNDDPRLWVGIYYKTMDTDPERSQILDELESDGWGGVMTWGADTTGANMNYYFNSPFLQTQSWATFGGDYLTPLVTGAHARSFQAGVDIEDVSPYKWQGNQWTAANIKNVADDLAASGVDVVFEEGFSFNTSVFLSLAAELKLKGVNYIAGTDPMILREPGFSNLWEKTHEINMYNYYIDRDHVFPGSALAQHGSIGYGWARYWDKPMGFMATISQPWGTPVQYAKAVVSYLGLIRALQFNLRDFFILGNEELLTGQSSFDPNWLKDRIQTYRGLQETDRPLLNIVVLMNNTPLPAGESTWEWNNFHNSGDAITSGAFHAGYDVVVSNEVVPADAYWVYVAGGQTAIPAAVAALFQTGKKVFLQSGSNLPCGPNISANWEAILNSCGIDAENGNSGNAFPELDLSHTGYYKGEQLTFTGTDTQWDLDLRGGTAFPEDVVTGTVYCKPDQTSDEAPFIVGDNNKYVVAANCLNWSVSSVISDLLSGAGTSITSNVWGIAGKNVSALIAVAPTTLKLTIPGLANGSAIHVEVWDKNKVMKSDMNTNYCAPFTLSMDKYDFVIIEKVN